MQKAKEGLRDREGERVGQRERERERPKERERERERDVELGEKAACTSPEGPSGFEPHEKE